MREQQPHASDEELARQTQAGSLSSFEELVWRHEQRVFRFLARCCRNEEDARELTQTAFIKAFRSIHRYLPGRPFLTWLFALARHAFIDHCRTAHPTLEMEAAAVPCDTDDPSVILARRERHDDLWSRVRALLSPDQFSALWLMYQEDMSVKDIARSLNRTQTSVKVLLFRGRRALIKASGRLLAGEPPGLSSRPGPQESQAARRASLANEQRMPVTTTLPFQTK